MGVASEKKEYSDNIFSFPDAVRKEMVDLSDKAVSYVQPLLDEQSVDLARLGVIIEVYNTVMRFSNWVGAPAKRSSLGMKLAATVLIEGQKCRKLDAERASKAVLEVVGEEPNSIEEKLAVVIMFYSTFPKCMSPHNLPHKKEVKTNSHQLNLMRRSKVFSEAKSRMLSRHV